MMTIDPEQKKIDQAIDTDIDQAIEDKKCCAECQWLESEHLGTVRRDLGSHERPQGESR